MIWALLREGVSARWLYNQASLFRETVTNVFLELDTLEYKIKLSLFFCGSTFWGAATPQTFSYLISL